VKNNIEIHPIPGPSALASMISIAGTDLQKFLFLGFPPHKKGRETFFKKVIGSKYPVIYYESPHRFIKNLELLKLLECQKRIIIGRELTKIFEEVQRGSAGEILIYYQENKDKIKGEFSVIVY
jgi:16S rRNA (cytidine1402-2'-O)-methyltransferase